MSPAGYRLRATGYGQNRERRTSSSFLAVGRSPLAVTIFIAVTPR